MTQPADPPPPAPTPDPAPAPAPTPDPAPPPAPPPPVDPVTLVQDDIAAAVAALQAYNAAVATAKDEQAKADQALGAAHTQQGVADQAAAAAHTAHLTLVAALTKAETDVGALDPNPGG